VGNRAVPCRGLDDPTGIAAYKQFLFVVDRTKCSRSFEEKATVFAPAEISSFSQLVSMTSYRPDTGGGFVSAGVKEKGGSVVLTHRQSEHDGKCVWSPGGRNAVWPATGEADI
jgi:hypothetical protein